MHHRWGWGVVALLALGACEIRTELAIPTPEDVESYYTYDGRLEAEVRGNVATIHVSQDPELLQRGGTLWAKSGPYFFLFSEETQRLFQDYPGLAAVRVVTEVGHTEVARALLTREEMNDILWRRALNIAGKARLQGTKRVTLIEDLVRWGERHAEYEYNPRYIRKR